MNRKIFYLFMIVFSYSTSAFSTGGCWHSGGAKLCDSSNNAWFYGQPLVTYCFVIDAENFGIPLMKARKAFHDALDYWDKEFDLRMTDAESYTRPFYFQEVECDQNPDFNVQLGVLSEDQKKYLGQTNEIAAVSVKTEPREDLILREFNLDKENIPIKGFMYISPEHGDLALPQHVLSSRWSQPKLLSKIFMHELGHILGFSHSTTFDIMNVEIIKKILGLNGEINTNLTAVSTNAKILKKSNVLCDLPFSHFFGARKKGEVIVNHSDPQRNSLNQLLNGSFGYFLKISWDHKNITISSSHDSDHFDTVIELKNGFESFQSFPLSAQSYHSAFLSTQLERRYVRSIAFPHFIFHFDYEGIVIIGQNKDSYLIQTPKIPYDNIVIS